MNKFNINIDFGGVIAACLIIGAVLFIGYILLVYAPHRDQLWAECSQYETVGQMPAKCAELFR